MHVASCSYNIFYLYVKLCMYHDIPVRENLSLT